MRKLLIALLILLIPTLSYALDKKLGATNCFKVGIFDTIGNGIAFLDVVTPFAHTITKIQCGGNGATTMDETSDTMADEGSGYYYICANDAITNNPEEECLGWVEGEGTMLNLIAKSPVKFKSAAIVDGEYTGSVVSSADCTNSTTVFDSTRTDAGVNRWKDPFLTFSSNTLTAELQGQTKAITASAINGCITVRGGFTTTPQAGDVFIIINK